jgi:hypothetical protein
LNAETAKANEEAERERLARVKIEATLGPRTLTKEQQARIALKLSQFAGKPIVVFVFAQDDWNGRESLKFSESVVSSLRAAYLDAYGYSGMMADGVHWDIQGLWVSTPDDCPMPLRIIAGKIWEALSAEIVSVGKIIVPIPIPQQAMFAGESPAPGEKPLDTSKGWPQIKVFIGRKPIPILGEPSR